MEDKEIDWDEYYEEQYKLRHCHSLSDLSEEDRANFEGWLDACQEDAQEQWDYEHR